MDLLKVYRTGPRSFRLAGELDLSCLDRLKPIQAQATLGGDLVLDFARLTFVDGAALGCIAQLAGDLARNGGGRLVIQRPQRSIERLLKRLPATEQIGNLVVTRLHAVIDDSFEGKGPPRDLSRLIASDHPPEAVCALIADLASGVLGAEGASVAVSNSGELISGASSDGLAEEVQRLQVQLNEGPAVDAVRRGCRQLSLSLVTERRWPRFCNEALYSGVGSVLSEPLVVRGSAVGAVTMFSRREHAFGESSLESAATLASQGAVVVANAVLYWQATELAGQLREALESRAVIDQAKGILMAREGLTADEAFAVLLKASQRGNSKVRQIAENLVLETQSVSAKGMT